RVETAQVFRGETALVETPGGPGQSAAELGELREPTHRLIMSRAGSRPRPTRTPRPARAAPARPRAPLPRSARVERYEAKKRRASDDEGRILSTSTCEASLSPPEWRLRRNFGPRRAEHTESA